MNIAIIFAGGTGKRMNTKSVPKQFLELHGKPVIIYTLEKYENHPEIDQIVMVCLESWIPYAKKLFSKFQLTKIVDIVPGGKTGQESIYNGIMVAHRISSDESDIVLIHDGVRPMIDEGTITSCLSCVREHGNAITTTPAIETIFVNDQDGQVGNIFNRSRCMMARAPQCFYLKDIYAAHQRARTEGKVDFIDSAMLMQHYGAKLYTVEGPVENIKITTPMDFYLFRAMLDAKENMQIVGV